jgi:hypothetical protein
MSDLRVTNLKGRTPGSSPTLPDGVVVTGVATATTFDGNLTGNVTGNADTATTATYATTAGIATNAQGLTGTPDVTVNNVVAGIITASNFVGVPPGFNELDASLFN